MKKARPKMLPQQVTIQRNEHEPEDLQLVARAILDIAEAFNRISHAGLTQRLVVLLLEDMTGLKKSDIKLLLNAAPKIASTYLKG